VADVRAEVQGLAELRKKLRSAGPELAARALEKALQAGGAVIEKAMRARTPVKEGTLVADLHTTVEMAPNGTAGRALIGFGKEGHKARWVEFGHRQVAHGTAEKGRREIGHVPAHPFMRPAFEESQAEAKDAVAKELGNGLKEIK